MSSPEYQGGGLAEGMLFKNEKRGEGQREERERGGGSVD